MLLCTDAPIDEAEQLSEGQKIGRGLPLAAERKYRILSRISGDIGRI